MKTKNTFLILAGLSNLLVAMLHTIGGQIDLVNPLLNSELDNAIKTQLLGAWHMVTIILFASAAILLYASFKRNAQIRLETLSFIAYLYILFSLPSLVIGFIYGMLVPQWILLFPIGVLAMIGVKKERRME